MAVSVKYGAKHLAKLENEVSLNALKTLSSVKSVTLSTFAVVQSGSDCVQSVR